MAGAFLELKGKPMVRIFLVRHGEPAGAWGVVDDPGLTERGQTQARAAAETIAGFGDVGLVSSPLRRCRDTAAPTAKRSDATMTWSLVCN